MGLLGNTTHEEYYQGDDLGNYQFVSLKDIINCAKPTNIAPIPTPIKAIAPPRAKTPFHAP